MKVIALNGIFVLTPAAIVLFSLASKGVFGKTFKLLSLIELVAGAVNLALVVLNVRDGLLMTGRLRRTADASNRQ